MRINKCMAPLATCIAMLLSTYSQAATTHYLQNTVLGQPEFAECARQYKESSVLSDDCDLLWYRLEAKLAGRSEEEQDEVVKQRRGVLEIRRLEQAAQRLEREKLLAEQEKAQAALIEEQAKEWAEANKRKKDNAPRIISKLAKLDFCDLYGQVLRDELSDSSEIKYFDNPHLLQLVRAEAKKRGMALNDKRIREGVVNIGMNICSMYASLGVPETENRSVGAWGVHIQHVYSGLYVYTSNGIITSWQD